MFKQIKKLTALFFVAATMFTFASCNKDNTDDDNPSGGGSSSISEANLVGEWGWPSSHEMKKKTIVIKADHTGAGNLMAGGFEWTLNGNKFVAKNGFKQLEMTIKSINGDKMEVEGKYQQLDGDGNVTNVLNNATGTLIKTVTTQSPTLTESLMVGTWKFRDSQTYRTYDVIINSDHTFTHNKYYLDEGTWEIEGSKFIGRTGSYSTEYSFIVESITSSAMSVVLNTVDGIDGTLTSITGTYTKNI